MGNKIEIGELLSENKKIDPKKLKKLKSEFNKIQASLVEEQKINRLKCPLADGKTMQETYD